MKGIIDLKGSIALVLIALVAIFSILGCDKGQNPVTDEGEATTVADVKTTAGVPTGVVVEGVEIVASGVAAAPSVVKKVDASDADLEVSLTHKETEDDGDEVVVLTATNGKFIGKDRFRFYADDDYLGRITLSSADSLVELHVRLDDEDLPEEGTVLIDVEVSRDTGDGREVVAEADLDIERTPPANGPRFEEAKLGKRDNQIILVFSNDVDVYRAVKSNLSVVDEDGDDWTVSSYGEDADEVTIIMRKDLTAGEYDIEYNGKGGLEGLDGEEVGKFSTTITVEDDAPLALIPCLERAEVGEEKDEILLVFSDDVDGKRNAIKKNITVVNEYDDEWDVRSHSENGDEITLVLSRELTVGEYTVTYNGNGGLESLDGDDVKKFETSITVEDDAPPPAPAEAVWMRIRKGDYASGNAFKTELEDYGYTVWPFARDILWSNDFEVEDVSGTTDLYRVTAKELGVTAPYTIVDVMVAAASNGYKLVPPETGAQLRLSHPNQPKGETLTVLSTALTMLGDDGKYVFGLGGGNDDHPGKHLIGVGIWGTVDSAEYHTFVVTK